MLDPIYSTTITRFVHRLPAIDRFSWEHNSDESYTINPISIVANFQSLPTEVTQRASDHTVPEGGSALEYPCDRGLGPLGPVAPMEATTDQWSTTSSFVFP